MPVGMDRLGTIIEGHEVFASADAKYRALVEAHEQHPVALTQEVSGYTDTFALSETEGDIFRIEAAQVPGLAWAYERYESLIGSMDGYFDEFRENERAAHAAFFRGEWHWSFDAAFGFMTQVCGQPGPAVLGWVCKIVAAGLRGGLYDGPEDR
jgi:hypothetical protein